MNILPKKKWHVRNQDNRDRVRRDEENAIQEKKREEERIALTEQEVRMKLLRGASNLSSDGSSSQHINLFAQEESEGGLSKRDNADYLKEKKEEQEKYEKSIGFLTYVGQSSLEVQKEQPWYLEKKPSSKLEHNLKDETRKSRLDPMSVVKESLTVLKKDSHQPKKKKKKKSPPHSTASIDQLRSERIRREKIERERANELLAGKHDKPVSETPQRYSNQFNPHLARQNKHGYHPY